jgi:hypothetical protein
MTEQEYIIATNRVKITIAIAAIRDVLPGDNFGISDKEEGEVMRILCDAEQRLFGLTKIDEESPYKYITPHEKKELMDRITVDGSIDGPLYLNEMAKLNRENKAKL